MVQKKGKYIK